MTKGETFIRRKRETGRGREREKHLGSESYLSHKPMMERVKKGNKIQFRLIKHYSLPSVGQSTLLFQILN